MSQNYNWECPYCGRHQVVTDDNSYNGKHPIYDKEMSGGPVVLWTQGVVCANKECRRLTLIASLTTHKTNQNYDIVWGDFIRNFKLLPESSAKPLPDYIPEQIRENYTQACRIRDLSAWASATMSRRCLQGMIRDFCGITKKVLGPVEIQDSQTVLFMIQASFWRRLE